MPRLPIRPFPTVLTAALAQVTAAVQAAIPAGERTALLDLYADRNGPGWAYQANWNGPAGTECTGWGVTCGAWLAKRG